MLRELAEQRRRGGGGERDELQSLTPCLMSRCDCNRGVCSIFFTMSCSGSSLLRLHHSFHSPRVEVAVEASKSQQVFSDSKLRARLSSHRSFSLILQSAFTGQRRIFRCNFANIAVSQRMLGTKQARCVPVCLFGGLFGNKQTKAASKVPDLKFHESTAIPFPSSLLAETFLAGQLFCSSSSMPSSVSFSL